MWPTGAQGQAEVQWHHCSSESTVSRLPDCHAPGQPLFLCRYGINKTHVHVCCQLLCIVCTIALSVLLCCLYHCAVCTLALSVPVYCLNHRAVCTITLSVLLICCISSSQSMWYECSISVCVCLLPLLAPRLLQYMTARAFKLIA